jgi:hypothetical protein
METQIARDGVVIGTFQLEDLPQAIASGTILSDDYAWHEGLSSWTPVSELNLSSERTAPPSPISSGENDEKTASSSSQPREKKDWREAKATKAQLGYLSSFGVNPSPDITRGEAHELIDKCTKDPKALKVQAELNEKRDAERFERWEIAEEEARKKLAAMGAYSFRISVEKAKYEIENWKAEKASNSLLYRAKKKEMAQLQKKLADADEEQRGDALNVIEDLEGEIEDLDPTTNPDPQDLSDWKEELKEHEDCRIQFWKATFDDDWIDSGNGDSLLDFADTITRLYSEFGRNFIPPTKKMIRAVLDALDSKSADWDKVSPDLFFGAFSELFPSHSQPPSPRLVVSRQPKTAYENPLVAKPRTVLTPKPQPKSAVAHSAAKGCLGLVFFALIGSGVFVAIIL